MRTLICFLAMMSLWPGAEAQLILQRGRKPIPGPATVYILNQGFEGVGYDNSEVWTATSGAPTEDPDNTEFVISGSQNIVLRRSGGTSANASCYLAAFGGTTNQSILYGYGVVMTTTTNANNVLFNCRTNGSGKNFIRISSAGRLQISSSNGAVLASPTDGVPTNAPIHIYWSINNTAGTGFVEWNTTAAFFLSGSKFASFSGGATGMLINQLALQASVATTTNWMDNVRVTTTALY